MIWVLARYTCGACRAQFYSRVAAPALLLATVECPCCQQMAACLTGTAHPLPRTMVLADKDLFEEESDDTITDLTIRYHHARDDAALRRLAH